MVLNIYLENRLADQRMHNAQCVAKFDCLLKGRFQEAKNLGWGSPPGVALLPLMLAWLPVQKGVELIKRLLA